MTGQVIQNWTRAENAFAALILIGCIDVKKVCLANEFLQEIIKVTYLDNLLVPEDTISMLELARSFVVEFALARFVVL